MMNTSTPALTADNVMRTFSFHRQRAIAVAAGRRVGRPGQQLAVGVAGCGCCSVIASLSLNLIKENLISTSGPISMRLFWSQNR